MNALITGTDTGVGKTYVTACILRAARASGLDVIAAKPFCTGDPADVAALQAANGTREPDHLINPVWFHTPLAPFVAAMVENRHIDLPRVREAFAELSGRHAHVLIEGAGGIMVPILRDYDFRDLAQDLRLDVLLVAANRLGALNHVRLTLDALSHRQLRCRAVILNAVTDRADLAQTTNPGILAELTGTPVIPVAHGQEDFRDLIDRIFVA